MAVGRHVTSLDAAFVSLFLILIASVLALPSSGAKGLRVDIAEPSTGPCGDGDRLLFASVLPDGRVRLNEDYIEMGALESRLTEIFRNRTESVVFVIPDPNSSFGQVTVLLDTARRRVDHVALLSHAVLRDQGNCGPVIPVCQQPAIQTPDLKFVPMWPW